MNWLLKSLFSKRKLIYSTFNLNDYMTMMNKLESVGVPFILKSKRSNMNQGANWGSSNSLTEYCFYVKVEDLGRAYKAMNP